MSSAKRLGIIIGIALGVAGSAGLVFGFSRKAEALAENPGVFQLDSAAAYSQILAVSDVHGMFEPLKTLLVAQHVVDGAQHWTAGKTLLIVLGDSIDKGPQSVEVLDLFSALSSEALQAGGRVVHLLGNHEAEFLADPTNSKAAELLSELKQKNIPVNEMVDPRFPRGAFLRSLPVAARVGKWLFVHSGWYPEMKWADFVQKSQLLLNAGNYADTFFLADDSMLESKDWWSDPSVRKKMEDRLDENSMYGVVQGHQPKAYGIDNRIGSIDRGRLIKIDCGMSPPAGTNPGQLLRIAAPSTLSSGEVQAEVLSSDGTSTPVVPQ